MKNTEKKDKPATASKQSRPKNKTGEIKRVRDIAARKQAEETLEQNRIWMENIFNALEEAILVVSPNRELININKAAERIFGYSLDELKNQSTEVLHVDHEHFLEFGQRINKEFEQDKTASFEFKARRKNGEVFPSEHTVALLKNEKGEKLGIVSVVRDITERKRAEQEIMKLYNAVEQSADIIYITDRDGMIEHINLAFEAITGYSKEEIVGKSPRILSSGMMSDDYYQKLWKTILAGEVFRSEIINKKKNGELFYYGQTITPIKDASGHITHFVSTGKDVTERKQAENNLRKAEAKYRTLVEQIPSIVYTASPHQHIGVTYISPQIKTLGFTEEEWIADPTLWLKQIHPDDQARVMEDIVRISQSTEPYKLEYRLRTRDGVIRWFLDEVMDIVDKDGNILFRQGFMLDITERKQAENEIRRRERHFTLLNQITHAILASRDSETIYQTLAHDLAKLFETDDCYITLWDGEKQQTIPVASAAQLERDYSVFHFQPGEITITASIMKSGQVLAVEDVLNSPHINPNISQQFPFRSALGIPLIVEEHRYGAAIVAFNTSYHFSLEEIARAEQVGQQIALALWTVQQEAEIQKRLRESDTLMKITRTLSETEQFGLQTVLQLIVTSAKELIPGVQQAVIHLLDEEQQTLSPGAVAGFDNPTDSPYPPARAKIPITEGVAGKVIAGGETINIADVEMDERFIPSDAPPMFRSLMVAPINSGEKKLGVISVQSGLVSAFTDDENRLLSALGTQAAIAIENVNLLENTKQALKESNSLYRINQGLVASLDPQELLKDVVNLLQKNFGYYHVQIYVVDPETGDLMMREGSGEIGRQLKEQRHKLRAGEGIVGFTAETGAPFFTNDVEKVYFFVRNQYLPNTKSELAVPVKISGRILGVLDVQQIPPARLTQRDLQLVNAVADQLAIALQKANLYADLQASLQMEKAIRNQMVQNERLATMGRLLASVSHELNNPLQAIHNALFLLRKEKGISLQGRQDLDIVLSESERMAALIDRLRATYRPIRMEDFQQTQVNKIIEDVYALIATHLRHNEISFEFHPDPDLPAIPGLTDQIRQVILNLLMNAVEAMTNGGRLAVSTQCLKESGEILLKVSDTGIGIDPAILPNIFDTFVTDKEKGTGLGLAISYDIILKHQGRITAENNPAGGATFNVWLPTRKMETP